MIPSYCVYNSLKKRHLEDKDLGSSFCSVGGIVLLQSGWVALLGAAF